ncbi:MAG TPA: PNGase F N-terminal domain-containing protein, partial [Enhygromyxa sp.]|nr:PNGase F N-terminal domain-containing protein [Enhygromyxa sp.]
MRPRESLFTALAASALSLACVAQPSASESGETADGSETASSTEADETETGESDEEDPFEPTIGEDLSVIAFDQTHVYFGEQNHRQIDVELSLPAAELAYESVTLELTLGCPNGACDWWDRKGFIGVVRDPGSEQESIIEVARFMTPYRVGAQHVIDVSELRPVLAGDLTMRVFIDTWVGPGHANGDGWLVDARFDFVGGAPTRVPIAAIPVWDLRSVEYGNPELPISESVPSV